MPSTPVYLAFAPPGLFGWSFVQGWQYVEAAVVDPESVGRPEQCAAIDAAGFRVWSNNSTTGGAFRAAGVPAFVIGEASPLGLPPEPAKDVDVVTVGENRWAPVTREALAGFSGSWRELPMMSNAALMGELGRGQLLVHCARIEGHSRIGMEARLMGTCCVGLASNRFAAGFDEENGGALVERVEDVQPLVEALLRDPQQLLQRQERARANAREEFRWDSYVERVGNAIAAIESDPGPERPWRAIAEQLVQHQMEQFS